MRRADLNDRWLVGFDVAGHCFELGKRQRGHARVGDFGDVKHRVALVDQRQAETANHQAVVWRHDRHIDAAERVATTPSVWPART